MLFTHQTSTPYPPAPLFFFLSSTSSILSSGISLYFSNKNSSISSLTSPCTTISSPPLATFVTELPVANFLPKSLLTFFRSSPKASRPVTAVTYFLLLRSTRLIVIMEVESLVAKRASAASALAAFFWASFAARFWASTDRCDVAAERASSWQGRGQYLAVFEE